MDCLQWTLSAIGIMTIIAFIILCGMLLWNFATDAVRDLKWRYKRKHRFDKPPTAQCYCKDCKYYIIYSSFHGRCSRGHIEQWNIADNNFCWMAEPLKSDPELVDER